jgi:hypothetical protein
MLLALAIYLDEDDLKDLIGVMKQKLMAELRGI